MSLEVANRGFHSTRRRFEKLFGKIRSFNVVKRKMITSYQNWEKRLVEVINTLKEIRQNLENNSNTANSVKIGGQISTILGYIASICGIVVNDKNVSEAFERVGKILTVAGTLTDKGCTLVGKKLTNYNCNQAKKAIETLTKITEELEDDRKEYFRFIQEYSALLEELHENELEIIYNFLRENNMENIEYDAYLDPSVENKIPPNTEKMSQLKLDEDVMNVRIEFNLIPEISAEMRDNPILKHILSKKCQSLPFVSGENAVKAIRAGITTIQTTSTALDLLPTNRKLSKLQNSAKILGLFDSIFNLVLTVSNRGQVSEQCKEIQRVENELEQYRSDVMMILSETLKWNFFEDNSHCVTDGNSNKRD